MLFVGTIMAFAIIIPKDNNSYFNEYNKKVSLLESCSKPRIVIIGGSSVAFDTDSKMIKDQIRKNVVNFGLHAGIGIRYPIEDALSYASLGDVYIFQIEYENFFSGGNGNMDNLPKFMVATNWRNADKLNLSQWSSIFLGLPKYGIGNVVRLMMLPIRGSLNTPSNSKIFEFAESGFNLYGDEVSHFNYPNTLVMASAHKDKGEIDQSFLVWLKDVIAKYNQKGACVIMVPPACVSSNFYASYDDKIEASLRNAGILYAVKPSEMVVDDSCSFDGGTYHLNREGVTQNSNKIIQIIRKEQ